MPYVWGVDSALSVTKERYDCVLYNYGKPEFWGRYLTTVPGQSEGITEKEIALLHDSGTRILPIYNQFRQAKGYRNGRVTAANMIFHARRLGIPDGKVLFAKVERFFPVDAGWISGFVDAFNPSGYKPGIYHDPVTGGFSEAFCRAAAENPKVTDQTILWSAEPHPGASGRNDAPPFSPKKVPCRANSWGWQYGREAEACPVDTNLIDKRLYGLLW